jgi:chaperonin GroES
MEMSIVRLLKTRLRTLLILHKSQSFRLLCQLYHQQVKPAIKIRYHTEPQEAEVKTSGGIFIPDSAQEKPQKGKVVAVGSGTKDVEMEVKAGDTVLYGKYSGTELQFDGKDYLIMRQSDILAVI